MRGSVLVLVLTCAVGAGPGAAIAQAPGVPVGVGGRVEVPEAGLAVTFPAGWVWYRTPVIDTRRVMDTYAAVADPGFADVFEDYVLFSEDDWLAESELFGEEDWFAELVGVSAHPSSGEEGAGPYDRCDVGTSYYESLDDYVEKQLHFWEQYGQELYPEGMDVAELALPAGEAVRLDTFESSEYAVLGGMGVITLYCIGLDVPDDRWLSIAETFEVLSAEE